jgi:hypothetical protein
MTVSREDAPHGARILRENSGPIGVAKRKAPPKRGESQMKEHNEGHSTRSRHPRQGSTSWSALCSPGRGLKHCAGAPFQYVFQSPGASLRQGR